MNAKIQLFIDHFSQPCRAVVIFCDILKLPYIIKKMNLVALDHKSKDFKKINPALTVPGMLDLENNFSTGESHTIMRYLSEKF